MYQEPGQVGREKAPAQPGKGWQMTADEIRRWAGLHAATLDLSEWEDEYSDDGEAQDLDAGDQAEG